MRIVFFIHPSFIGSQSMPRFAQMLIDGMEQRGHQLEYWLPKSRFFLLLAPKSFKKWLGYIDRFIIFPIEVRRRLKYCPTDTLFVLTDNAQGPWLPLVAHRPHIVHCHDLLAQKSALGKISNNRTSWTGRQYQAFILRGLMKGRNFISVSEKTRDDLHELFQIAPKNSEVVYNGLNQLFPILDPVQARNSLGKKVLIDLEEGYILHVGNNQWYKNRTGVIEIYDAWRGLNNLKLPLLLIGPNPSAQLEDRYSKSPYKSDIYLLTGLDNDFVRLAYAGATVFIFPSLAEGFGWPIAEAMASGCPVITTNEAPMTEVAGQAGFFIPRCPDLKHEVKGWAIEAAKVVNNVIQLTSEERKKVIKNGFDNAERFDTNKALNKIEYIYEKVLSN